MNRIVTSRDIRVPVSFRRMLCSLGLAISQLTFLDSAPISTASLRTRAPRTTPVPVPPLVNVSTTSTINYTESPFQDPVSMGLMLTAWMLLACCCIVSCETHCLPHLYHAFVSAVRSPSYSPERVGATSLEVAGATPEVANATLGFPIDSREAVTIEIIKEVYDQMVQRGQLTDQEIQMVDRLLKCLENIPRLYSADDASGSTNHTSDSSRLEELKRAVSHRLGHVPISFDNWLDSTMLVLTMCHVTHPDSNQLGASPLASSPPKIWFTHDFTSISQALLLKNTCPLTNNVLLPHSDTAFFLDYTINSKSVRFDSRLKPDIISMLAIFIAKQVGKHGSIESGELQRFLTGLFSPPPERTESGGGVLPHNIPISEEGSVVSSVLVRDSNIPMVAWGVLLILHDQFLRPA